MKNNKDSIEMIIYVSDLTKYNQACAPWVELDLMKPQEAKNKYKAFQKEREGHALVISDTSMTYSIGINKLYNIDYLLELADVYFANWSEEQLMVFSDLINELDWDWDDACNKVNNYYYSLIKIGSYKSDEDAVGRYYAEYLDIPDYIKKYFDYEKYGRDVIIESDSITTDDYVIIVY